jgi:nucleoid DNA-binding protein
MNRSELVAIVASNGGFRKSDAEKAVDNLLTAITDALKRGDSVRLRVSARSLSLPARQSKPATRGRASR